MTSGLGTQAALNRIAGTSGLAEQGAANAAVTRIDGISARLAFSLAPTGTLAETFPRAGGATTNGGALSSGRMTLAAIALPAGLIVTSITFYSATTALDTSTHQWFALYNSSLALLRQTTNDTSTAWASNTAKNLALTTPVTTTYSGLYYVGINVTASTVPSLVCSSGLQTSANTVTPRLAGNSDTGLTATAPTTAAAPGVGSFYIYATVS